MPLAPSLSIRLPQLFLVDCILFYCPPSMSLVSLGHEAVTAGCHRCQNGPDDAAIKLINSHS